MNNNYLKGIIEEILYIWGEAIDINDLGKIIFDAEKSEIKKAIKEMMDERNNKESGLIIKKYENKYQFATRPDHEKYISNIIKKSEKNLSNSSLETLSIIAYKQPITRAEIDKIRGVKSQSTIDSLLDKKLIRENGRLDKIGKPIIYVTTDLFLKYFNISDLSQLPKIDDEIAGNLDED
ncbi:MAG: SMC-Scp complex subunit ScpB [Anaerococcus vaginalis]|nr:SMC-Scp complex subunit ScpB [Anaerococcus vaginalis]